MEIPLFGKVKLYETSKTELLDLWNDVLGKNAIVINEHAKVESIVFSDRRFTVETAEKVKFTARKVLLAIGRRGTPRKLNIPGEVSTKVAYRLLEPEQIEYKRIVVVGGGDSAIEAALLLADKNQVTLSYRGDSFGRIKAGNNQKIKAAIAEQKIDVKLNTNLIFIEEHRVNIEDRVSGSVYPLENDLVYIFAGGELPTQFLEKAGIRITKKFGEAILKHN